MANEKQLAILSDGVDVWNKWRQENPSITIDLSEANLRDAKLSHVNLSKANLYRADLVKADLRTADLSGANLHQCMLYEANLNLAYLNECNLNDADLIQAKLRYAKLENADLTKARLNFADLSFADLHGCNLSGASLMEADLSLATLNDADLSHANLEGVILDKADLSNANLTGANLRGVSLIGTNVSQAYLSGSMVHAINVWDLEGEFGEQKDLVITPPNAPTITVDNVRIAQFIYLILNNEQIRDVIDTLTSKSVLILGRFTVPERKAILDALRDKLREYDLLPIVFDFDRPMDKDFTETVKTLAGLSYFVIADVTSPKSSPLELQAIAPDYQIPIVPIIQEGESPFAMMVDLQKKHNWVLNTVTYDSLETLIKVLKPLIIDPAMKKRQELRLIKARVPEVISGKSFLEKGRE